MAELVKDEAFYKRICNNFCLDCGEVIDLLHEAKRRLSRYGKMTDDVDELLKYCICQLYLSKTTTMDYLCSKNEEDVKKADIKAYKRYFLGCEEANEL